jgi:hypothetical protein
LLKSICDAFARLFGLRRPAPPKPEAADIGKIIVEIRNTIANVERESAILGVPPFHSAEITLQALLNSTVQGEAQIFIITLGDKVEYEQVHQISLTIAPPKQSLTDMRLGEFSKDLSVAILAAVRAANDALRDHPALELGKVVASVSFVARTAVSGKLAGKIELVPLTASFGASISRAAQHKVQLTFGA